MLEGHLHGNGMESGPAGVILVALQIHKPK